ncbi:patronin isoform X6 [Chironomus tepperi]|uniref:patronin isoform X6 n=1 Tax=Chironomus tepperi TaxID=113505 RepID=UPI00391F931D
MSTSNRQSEDGLAESTRKAKQRASIRWLLSKAFNNRVPDQLREPFYTDHDGNQHLKPQIVVGLGNASIYCQVLSNIYSDPNYQSLNHWSILQTLCRKGVPILDERAGEPPLTETVLIQTNPIRIHAHMSVIEALMILYAKEVTSGDRVHSAVNKLTSGSVPSGLNSEQLLLLWVSHVMASLKRRIDHDLTINELVDEKGKKLRTPDIPAPIQDITSLCDGVCLAYLIAFYCPKILPWYQIRISYLPTVEDSLHNVLLINNFSERHLPYSVFHMMAEDVTYMRGNMKQNLVVLLADMFNLFEIHPAPCVDYPECENSTGEIATNQSKTNEHGIAHRRGFTTQTIQPIPDLRSGYNSPPSSAGSTSGRPPFQVVRSPSSNNVYRHHTPPKEVFYGTSTTNSSSNNGNMEADSEFVVHRSKGIPTLSNMHDPLIPAKLRQSKEKSNNDTKADERGDKAAGRPSNWDDRKTSYAGRRSRRNSFSEDSQLTIENFGGSQDQLNMIGTFDRRSQDRERKISNTSIEPTLPARSSIADARGTLVIGYESDGEKEDKESEKPHLKRQNSNTSSSNSSGVHQMVVEEKRKMSSFASLAPAATTTWQQQSVNAHQMNEMRDTNQPFVDDSKLSSVRLKLEEKRRHIEKEKRRLESQMSKQLQKVGKAAFLQAINKREKSSEDGKTESDLVMVDSVEKPVSLQDVTMDQPQWSKKLPDYEHNNNISLEQYQQSIAVMNSDLHDIQEDIQKLAEQQNQIQVQTMQAQQLLQAQQIANILTQQYGSQQNITGMYHPLQQQYNSTPQLPIQKPIHHQYINDQGQYVNQKIQSRENSRIIEDQYSSPSQYLNHEQQKHIAKYVQETNNFRDQYEPQQPQFFLHGETPSQVSTPPTQVSTPPVPARRTWSQKAPPEMSTWSQQQQIQQQQQTQQQNMNKYDTWKSPSNQNLHQQLQQQPQQQQQPTPVKPQNSGFVLHKQNGRESEAQRLFPVVHATPPKPNQSRIPDEMMMAPQSISFIGDEEDVDEADNYQSPIPRNNGSSIKKSFDKIDEFEASFGKLNITSGSRTYRIPSPTIRQGIADSSYKSIESQNENENEKGFYISFDNDKQPKRPKPPLRTKKSPKKSSEDYDNADNFVDTQEIVSKKVFDLHHTEKKPTMESIKPNNNYSVHEQPYQPRISTPKESQAIVIADDQNFDMSVDEMERKKEKIMLLSLQRRQQQEEAKARKEIEAMQRREREQEKEDEKSRKKEEQMARRAQILEQHRLKKAIEEAEREGKTLDRHTTEMLMKQQQHQQSMATPQPKMRMNKPQRPRPKTIHVETNASIDISGSGKKGSNSNLTESPDEYPSCSTTSTPLSNVGRRSSYNKYGKEPPNQGIERGRTLTRISSISKYGGAAQAGANFRGRKSNSLMNLCGDSDSGLGRTTPPRRRAASPGMGSGSSSRHLPSPSGPGSLPHPSLMSKRRVIGYDDGASDISSTQSSIFGDYNGPRLYKQPAAKSNRGILLNAVEYCVFPGVVNRDAKQKVLEKIARSEAKHFLVLFRDAGCQFRALYSYDPETEAVIKLYGTGPSNVYDVMFDKFFKYNSGGKCFAQVHTKHLTVTCDAFTIHNSLWQGKKASNLPSKRDMALVI